MLLAGGPALRAEGASGAKFDPHSKSHFLLRELPQAVSWFQARALASQMERDGVRGRLALVRDAATHLFLEKTFELTGEAWIGLRYWCRLQRAKWVTGENHDRSRLNAWAEPWYLEETGHCGGERGHAAAAYMPVYYLTQDKGFRWRAASPRVGAERFFVEFPSQEEAGADGEGAEASAN